MRKATATMRRIGMSLIAHKRMQLSVANLKTGTEGDSAIDGKDLLAVLSEHDRVVFSRHQHTHIL